MRPLIIAIILSVHCTIAVAQAQTPQTEIMIIGTIHGGNKKFDHKTLYEVLKKNKPDIILWEQSTKFERVFGLRTANFLRIWNPGIEQLSLQKFSKLHRGVEILPFDTTFTNKRKYLKNRIDVTQTFHDNLYKVKKSIVDSTIYADYANKHTLYFNHLDTAALKRINQSDIIDISRALYNLEDEVILPLGKNYISDSTVVNNFGTEVQFWKDRNDHMVNQILKYAKQFAGKRIIVLTGLSHKYYLQDKLSDPQKSIVKIVEFVEE